ncbi:hypothetical protein [Bacillus anthracis]|uniref:Uncharacterized protein n=1 Tax=Bacillus anthracis TaxID=1392 RepID=A0A0J1HJZ2_BACAN|nr:hypothetical protein [Bacillus anthracis]KLV14086.1 hypothetical protein ABW01_28915 [Bacillus anthracis]
MDSVRNIVIKEVLWGFVRHNDQGYTEDNIATNTKIIDIFPSKNFEDEQADRLGISLLESWRSICNEMEILDAEIGYDLREEYQMFSIVEDVILYFENWAQLCKEED